MLRKRSRDTAPGAARCSPCGGSCAAIPGAAAATTRSPRVWSLGRAPFKPSPMEQRNLLLAIVLSVGILIAFQYVAERMRPPAPPPTPPRPAATQTAPSTPAPDSAVPGVATPEPAVAGAAAKAPAPATREAALAEQPRV